MKAKYYLASLSLVGLFAACSNEEFLNEQTNSSFQGRPTVNLTLTGGADTRLSQSGSGVTFDTTDKLGAVIVDPTTVFTVADDVAIGNNKWSWDANKQAFVTEGTTAVGSWVFYSQYDPAVTTSRDGLIYSFKQIQEGDATSKASTAAGVDFFVSPVIMLDGYEGEEINISVKSRSINARALINAKFDPTLDVKEVQKIIVKQGTGNFIVKGKIINTALPVANITASALALTHKSANETIQEAANALATDRNAYPTSNIAVITAARGVTGDEETYLALDCINHETGKAMAVVNNEFKTQMMIPAGTYSELDLYIYTDKGIFKKTITKAVPDNDLLADADFHLRRGFYVNLGNMRLTEKGDPTAFAAAGLNITSAEKKTNAQVESETAGTVVLKTSDLVEAIKAIETNGDVNINVISDENHQTIINKDVMAAIAAKKAEKPNLQIIFSKAMKIIGEESEEAPLVLQDITFGDGAELVEGHAKIMADVNIPQYKKMTVASGACLEFAATANSIKGYSYTGLVNHGNVIVSGNVMIKAISPNDGTITIKETASLTNTYGSVVNNGTITNNGTWTVNVPLTNAPGATIQNNGDIAVAGTFAASNNGTINNQGSIELTTSGATTNSGTINNGVDGDATKAGNIEVQNTMANSGQINNYVGSVLLVNAAVTGALNNAVGATITNYGDLYCHEGNNTINNLGTIEAKSGATTYITTNSSGVETAGTASVTMGEILLSGRKDDVSVTTQNKKGYITWNVPADVTEIKKVAGDKFNKVVLSAPTTIKNDAYARFVVANAGTTELTLEKNIQELTFNTASTIYAEPGKDLKIGSLNVAQGVRVKLPTENVIGVYDVDNTTSKTVAAINNQGTILVGGNFWSSLEQPLTGTFASGDGNTTAFHWRKNASDYENAY